MNKEFEFLKIINNTLHDNSYLGDDCAYLDEYNLAVSSDILVEDVHFKKEYMSAYEIAQKALLVNISDILASGASIKYLTINLSGKLTNQFVEEFYQGVKDFEKIYNFKVIGGDLTKSDKIIISVSVFGDYKNRKISKRSNAQENYIAAVIGEFGSSVCGLKYLQKGLREETASEEEKYFISCHKKPKIFPKTSSIIAQNVKKPYAMMDSSDGLADCLIQIAQKSNVKIKIEYDKIPHKTPDKDFVLFGGEDYSLVVCLDEKDFDEINKIIDNKLIKIGIVEKLNTDKNETPCVFLDGEKLKYKGFEHFEKG